MVYGVDFGNGFWLTVAFQGEDVKTAAGLFRAAIEAQKNFLLVAAKHSCPADSDLQKVLEPQVKAITATTEFREKNRRSAFFNHLSSISEAIPALSWICVTPTPGPYVKDMKDAAMFYTNRVLKEFKGTAPKLTSFRQFYLPSLSGKDERHCEWTKKLLGALTALQAYIKEYHTTGLVWNTKVSLVHPGKRRFPFSPNLFLITLIFGEC